MRDSIRMAAGLLLLAALGGAARADEAQDIFDAVYGADYKKVVATPDVKDDADLAGKLLTAAKTTPADKPSLLALLCDKAFELAAKDPAAQATAMAAMDLLVEKAPEKKVDCLEKTLQLREKQYAAAMSKPAVRTELAPAMVDNLFALADCRLKTAQTAEAVKDARRALTVATAEKFANLAEVKARADQYIARERVGQQIVIFEGRLKADAKDKPAREEIVRLLVVEMDNPAEATKYLTEDLDQATRDNVPVAVWKVDEVQIDTCEKLANWYLTLAVKASAAAKPAMLNHAAGYYRRFLANHPDKDTARTTAEMALKKIEGELGDAAGVPALGASGGSAAPGSVVTPPADGWIDALKYAKEDVSAGTWLIKDAQATSPKTDRARLPLPIVPDGSYDLQVKFNCTEGDNVVVMLPAGAGTCMLKFWGGNNAGLNSIDGRDAGSNDSHAGGLKITSGQVHALDIRVALKADLADISADLDGKKLLHWAGRQASLALADWALPDARTLGIGAGNTICQFSAVKLRMATGAKARLLKDEDAITASLPAAPGGEWLDLLKSAKAECGKGKWEVKDGVVFAEKGDWSRLPLPVLIEGSYDLQVKMNRTEVQDDVRICLPVGAGAVEFCMGGPNWGSGLSNVDGKTLTQGSGIPFTNCPFVVEARVQVAGDKADILIHLNGRKFIAWNGKQSQLSGNPGDIPDGRMVGLMACKAACQFKAARVRMLSGIAKPAEGPADKEQPTTAPAADKWIDVLKMVKPDSPVVRGTFELKDGQLALCGKDTTCLALPASPAGNYELQAKFYRTQSRGEAQLHLPVGSATCALALFAGSNGHVGLDMINGKRAWQNTDVSTKMGNMFDNTVYDVLAKVESAGDSGEVTVTINGGESFHWKGKTSVLSLDNYIKLPDPGALGVTGNEGFVFKAIRLRMLTGEAKLAEAGK